MEESKFHHAGVSTKKLTLRWSDRQSLSALEQTGDLVRQDTSEWILSCPLRISAMTQVYLTGDWAMGNGIVRSCHQEGAAYILTVTMTPDASYASPRQEFDPGVLDLDNFLTEEEEAKILESLKDEIPYAVTVQRVVSQWCVRLGNWLAETATVLFHPLGSL